MTFPFCGRILRVSLIAAGCLACDGELFAQSKKPAIGNGPKPVFGPEVRQVFFDDAKAKLGPGAPPAVGGGGAKPAPRTPPPGMAGGSPAGGGGDGEGGTWSKWIPREVIEDEIKAQTAAMALAVKAKGKFKSGGYKDAQIQFTTVATLFGVVAQYDKGDVRWKDIAAALRDKVAKVGLALKEGNDDTHKQASDLAVLLQDLIGGNKLELPAANASTVPWPNVADLYPLMKRMETSQMGTLQPFTANKADFTANQDKLLHEAALLAAFGQVIQDSEYNEEEEYKAFAVQMQVAAGALAEAAKQGQFEAAQQAVGQISKSCNECHGKYK